MTESNPLHPEKAPSPIVVTEFGIVREPVRFQQSAKAETPIVVTEVPKVRDVKLPELRK